jgi:hypothetical protein
MTNADRVIEALGVHGSLSDSQLVRITGIRPHQQVNQLCRRLEAKGVLRRSKATSGSIINVLTAGSDTVHLPITPGSGRGDRDDHVQAQFEDVSARDLSAERAVLVLPCSARKRAGGSRHVRGDSILDLLPDRLSDRLARAREVMRPKAAVDESLLRPAWQRYEGTMYRAAGPAVDQAIADGVTVIIISGGYGLLLAAEPIGLYDRRFSPTDWPRGLLAECLTAAATAVGAIRVLAFCARTTGYAQLVGSIAWAETGVEAYLIAPDLAGLGGAQVLVPRASGEALVATLADGLMSPWSSSDGVAVRVERLR